jgi:hypothetical protein
VIDEDGYFDVKAIRKGLVSFAVLAERYAIRAHLLACAENHTTSLEVSYALRAMAGYVDDRIRLKKDAAAT